MTTPIAAVLGMLLAHGLAAPETGLLDRSITLGAVTYRYQVYVPAEHSRGTLWPVIVNLHGNGGQGSDALLPTRRGLADQIRANRSQFPAIVVFPQAAVGKRWLDGDMEELVIAQLERTVSEFGGDPARLYLTGFSMGATGAYRIAYRWPTRFAAIVAIAGRVETADARTYSDRDKEADRQANPFVTAPDPFAALAAMIKHIPIRVFHGDRDETVPVEQSRRFVPALQSAGANVQYHEYPGATHGDAATKAYADADLISWLLAQRRG
jgi:predicted peptidase